MDPNIVTDQQWVEYRHLVSLLWLFPLLMFVVTTCLLLRFGILPSLWNSRGEDVARSDQRWAQLHRIAVKAHGAWPLSQAALFVGTLTALVGLGVVFYFAQAWSRGVIEETFNRWWI